MKDIIYREDAINLIEKIETKRLKGEIELAYAPTLKGLMLLPSAERIGWTPCSEGLPKKYGEYLCCDIRGEYILGMPFENEDSDTGFSVETGSEYMYACIAWMPLPEPWKGEENDT